MRRKIWLVPLAMLATGAGYAYWLVWEGEEQYRKALDLAKRDGLIATAEELAGVRASSSENSAGFYQTAAIKLRSMSREERSLVYAYTRSKYTRDNWAKTYGYKPTVHHADLVCERYQDVIATLRKAAHRPRYDFLQDYGRWSSGPSFRDLFQFVTADAERCARKGNPTEAFERVAILRGLARQLAQEPLPMTAATLSAAESAAADAGVRVAWILRSDPSCTVSLRKVLAPSVACPHLITLQKVMLLQDLEGIQLVVSNPAALGLSRGDMWNPNLMFARLPQVQPRLKTAAIGRARRNLPLIRAGSIEGICLKLGEQDDTYDEFESRANFLNTGNMQGVTRRLASAEVTRQLAIAMSYVIDEWRANKKFPKDLPGEFRKSLSFDARKSLGIELDSEHLDATVSNSFIARLQLPPDYDKPEKKGPRTRE